MSIKTDTAEIQSKASTLTPWTRRPGYVTHVQEQIRRDSEHRLRREGRLRVVTTASEEQLNDWTEIVQDLVPEDQPVPRSIQYALADYSAKVCPGCRSVKLREDFHAGTADCKPCANEASREFHQQHPLVKKLSHGLSRAKRAGNHYEEVTPEALYAHWESVGIDPSKCYYTGVEISEGDLSLDHGQPIGKGGEHTVRNIYPTTLEVNVNRKRSLSVEEFQERLAQERSE